MVQKIISEMQHTSETPAKSTAGSTNNSTNIKNQLVPMGKLVAVTPTIVISSTVTPEKQLSSQSLSGINDTVVSNKGISFFSQSS
jgi:hypothetical protein